MYTRRLLIFYLLALFLVWDKTAFAQNSFPGYLNSRPNLENQTPATPQATDKLPVLRSGKLYGLRGDYFSTTAGSGGGAICIPLSCDGQPDGAQWWTGTAMARCGSVVAANCVLASGSTDDCLLVSGTLTDVLLVQ